jgi:hypothetical protein
MSILGCAGSDEPGANYTPPTLGKFLQDQRDNNRRLREASAGAQVIKEARDFHLKQSSRYGINTNRGLAHFRASKMYTREGGRLQEMFEQGGELGELPPKAIMKANKAAMMFHKKQADKAGLDSDLGHAHVAAMEHHQDIYGKAKQQHKQQAQQQQPMQAGKREALPGHGSKQSPVPVPKKSEQPNNDIQQPNKPPLQLNPQDANQPRRLQQNEAGRRPSLESRLRNFGKKREARGPDYGMERTLPRGAGTQVEPNLVTRQPRTSQKPRGHKLGDDPYKESGRRFSMRRGL